MSQRHIPHQRHQHQPLHQQLHMTTLLRLVPQQRPHHMTTLPHRQQQHRQQQHQQRHQQVRRHRRQVMKKLKQQTQVQPLLSILMRALSTTVMIMLTALTPWEVVMIVFALMDIKVTVSTVNLIRPP